MGWRDELRPASFRGVPFGVLEAEYAAGRRAEVHEFPQRETPYVEDLGRKARTYTVLGYVLGDDYLTRKRALLEALDTPGGASLVHPYFGVLPLLCSRVRVRETAAEGGYASFEMEFVEVGPERSHGRRLSREGTAEGSAAELEAEGALDVEEGLAAVGVPEEVRAASADQLTLLARQIRRLDVFAGRAAPVSELARKVANILSAAGSLAAAPANLAGAVLDALQLVLSTSRGARGALRAYEVLAAQGRAVIPGTSRQADQANANARRVQVWIRSCALAGAARACALIAWAHRQEAIAARDRLLAQIDETQGLADDRTFAALQALATSLARLLPPPGENLPQLGTYTPRGVQPSLVVAWDLYGSLEREGELVERNRLRLPAFVPPEPLEVLVDA